MGSPRTRPPGPSNFPTEEAVWKYPVEEAAWWYWDGSAWGEQALTVTEL
jgi:hypothetical protein